MDWKIIMKPEVYERIMCLSNNIKLINEGDEIGAWFMGEWQVTKDKATLLLDKFHIPKQKVTGAEVDISPESMIDTIKELGNGACNRIKAHWHIHPFGTGSTSWSGIDETKIKDFMEPAKGRRIFVFLLSSIDQIKARVVINYECMSPFGEEKAYLTQSVDDVSVECEGHVKADLIAELKKEVEAKVERRTYAYTEGEWWKKDDAFGMVKTESVKELFKLDSNSNEVIAYLNKAFYEYLMNTDTKLVEECDEVLDVGEVAKLIYKLKAGQKPKHVKKELRKVLEELEVDYADVENYNAGYNGYNQSEHPIWY